MSNKLNTEGVLLFEQPFVKVPYENYRKVFRISQKNIERDFQALSTGVQGLSEQTDGSGNEAALDVMLEKLETLKRKLSELHENSGKPTQTVMRERFEHLKGLEDMPSTSSPGFERWAETRLDRWLVDWTIRNGQEKTARMIAREKNIETLVDLNLFSDIKRIEASLEKRSCTEALAWCSENKSTLRKANNDLEFELRLQEFIELCRQRQLNEAIAHSRKYLQPWTVSHQDNITQAHILLVYTADTQHPPYKRLYNPARWDGLINSFRTSIYSINTLPSEPLLNLSLYAGLSSLKLHACYDGSLKNVDCPVCDLEGGQENAGRGLGKLAEDVPFSHHFNSTIVCRISGRIMDEDNMPMAFPNGRVYSREALEAMAKANSGIVTCPQTGTSCYFNDLRKVFIS